MFLSHRKLFFLFVGLILAVGFSSRQIYSQEKNTQNQETRIKTLISQLYQNPWLGAERVGESPTMWEFSLTEPMTKILDIGRATQSELLKEVDNPQIKDQIIFLLGGVGDEQSVEPIIKAMISKPELSKNPQAIKINQSANLALTNITVADVIWHHGGGIVIDKCSENAKECWEKWWAENKKSFSVKNIIQNRGYSNYPNYGIYKNKE